MAEIDEASKKIADIIGVIDEIAFQTNLLALNAAVEAARAGEQGRGFAVVASEVRNLAGRSATAAREIKHLIQDSRRKVDEGSSLVTDSGDTLEQLVSAVKQVSDIIAEIAAASQEQSSGIDQVNKAVMQLDAMTQQNSALVEEASAASELMADQARALTEMMDKYNVPQEGVAAGSAALADSRGDAAPPETQERRGAGRPWAKGDAKALPAKPSTPREPIGRTQPNIGAANGTDNEWQQF
jgi:methyl-accepting chemotaxis protein